MSSTKYLGKAEKLLLLEFKEAWQHYRHLELMRMQYLAFFFTLIFGCIGFTITALKDLQPQNTSQTLLGVFSLTWLLQMLTIVMFASVRKIRFVLMHYENVMKQVRAIIYPHEQNFWCDFNRHEIPHPATRMKIFDNQNVAEYILVSGSIILIAIEITGLLVFLQTTVLLAWQVYVMAFFVVTMFMMEVYVIIVPPVRARFEHHKMRTAMQDHL